MTGARAAGLALGIASGAWLVVALLRFDSWFTDPARIAALYALPLLATALCFAFLLLPGTGRLALGSVLATLLVTEGASRLAWTLREPHVVTGTEPGYFEHDPDLGWAPRRGARARAWKRVEEETLYEVEYHFDAHGRRLSPFVAAGADHFLLGFGGSCMLGEGVAPDETLLFQLARQLPDHQPYNYGFHGYGPPHTLARLEAGSLRAEVGEPSGTLVYLFIDAHVLRSVGSMVVHSGWAHEAPYYELDRDRVPRRRGSLTRGRPFTALLYGTLGQSATLRALGTDLPLRIGARHVDLTARILARAAGLFERQFGAASRFVVAIYPGSRLAAPLVTALRELGVDTLDYASLFDPAEAGYQIPWDGHPTASAYLRLAASLARDLSSTPGGRRDARTP